MFAGISRRLMANVGTHEWPSECGKGGIFRENAQCIGNPTWAALRFQSVPSQRCASRQRSQRSWSRRGRSCRPTHCADWQGKPACERQGLSCSRRPPPSPAWRPPALFHFCLPPPANASMSHPTPNYAEKEILGNVVPAKLYYANPTQRLKDYF